MGLRFALKEMKAILFTNEPKANKNLFIGLSTFNYPKNGLPLEIACIWNIPFLRL